MDANHSEKRDKPIGVVLDQPQKFTGIEIGEKVHRPTLVPPQHKQWTAGKCHCCARGSTCCYAVFCYFCLLRNLTEAMGEHCCVPCLPWCGIMSLRMKMRTAYGIQGSACDDCCQLCWCNGCVACQMHREAIELGLLEPTDCTQLCRRCCVCMI